jgi:hypothetical protein
MAGYNFYRKDGDLPMLSADDETEHLMGTLLFTLHVIIENTGGDRQRIADAYSQAQALAASIPWENGSARPRIVACLERSKAHQEANNLEAAGWMLTAIQERLAEQNLPDWEKLKIVADKAAQLLEPERRVH